MVTRVGRNDPCPCGSGKKYKHCCMNAGNGRNAHAQAANEPAAFSIPDAIRAGMQYQVTGKLSEAEALYMHVLRTNPDNAEALQLLGTVAYQAGQYERAVELIAKAILIEPGIPNYYSNLGSAYGALNRLDDAILCFKSALAIDPDYAEGYNKLGIALLSLGKPVEAVANFERAVVIDADFLDAYNNLGIAAQELGQIDKAIAGYRQMLRLQPENGVALHLIAALTGERTDGAPSQYVAQVFDRYAGTFDAKLTQELHYTIPEQLVALARQYAANTGQWDVLDLGCGTGLVGAAIASYARKLVGVDLSVNMLAKAGERGLYQRTECMDLLTMMRGEAASSYDVVIAADVFIYVGKIDEVVAEAKRLLRPGGLLVFSAEALEVLADAEADGGNQPGYCLNPTGRFAHSSRYLASLAKTNGLRTLQIQAGQGRLEQNRPVPVWLTAFEA
jgi:predicted TPR repeat methyltransferase